jgi:rubrerythrin
MQIIQEINNMAMIKKSRADRRTVAVSSFVYVCDKCGHTTMAKKMKTKTTCPKCHDGCLVLVSSETE